MTRRAERDVQEFEGERFVQGSGGYYRTRLHSLHRALWEHHHGPIPVGSIVHHIDENPGNNDLENLQCMTHSEHISYHSKLNARRRREFAEKHPVLVAARKAKRKAAREANKEAKVDNVVGERIRHYRTRKGWEVSRLSMETDIPEQTIRTWETHKDANPSLISVAKVAGALGVSVDDLLQADDSTG